MLLPYASLAILEIRAALLLDWIGTLGSHRGQLFRWTDLQQWLIRGNRLPGYEETDLRRALGREP